MNDKDLDKKLEAQLDRFGVGLFKYLDKRFGEIDTRMDQLESRMSTLEGGVDSVLKNQETDQQERLVVSHQLDRHEGWIKQLAQKTDTSLSYE